MFANISAIFILKRCIFDPADAHLLADSAHYIILYYFVGDLLEDGHVDVETYRKHTVK